MLDMIQYKKFPFAEFQGKFPCPQKPSRNSCDQSNTSNPKLPFRFINTDFCIIFKQYQAAKVSTTRIYAGRSGVQISAGAIELSFLQKTRLPPVPTLPPNQWNPELFSGSNVASADSLTTHIWLEPSLKISGAIPPLNLSASMAQWDNFIKPLPPTYV